MIFIRYFSIIKETLTAQIGLISYALKVHRLSLQLTDLLYYRLVDIGIECNREDTPQNITRNPLPAGRDPHRIPIDCPIDPDCQGDCWVDEEAS